MDHVVHCVVITSTGCQEHIVDTTPMSPYVTDILGGEVTFCGSWDDSHILMLRLKNPPDENEVVPRNLLPNTSIDTEPLKGPLLITKLDMDYNPVNFTVVDYEDLLRSLEQDS